MAVGKIVGSSLVNATPLIDPQEAISRTKAQNLRFLNRSLYETGVDLAMAVGLVCGLLAGWWFGWSWLLAGYVIGAVITAFAWASVVAMGNQP